ncbi:MAG: hypothetical protein NVS2B2_19330 [Ktedonobacteraceae bacterium]
MLKNCLDALLKPTVGKVYDTNAPGYLRNDTESFFSFLPSGDIMGSILIFRVRGLYLYSLLGQSPSLQQEFEKLP